MKNAMNLTGTSPKPTAAEWKISLVMILSAALVAVGRQFGSIEYAVGALGLRPGIESAAFMFAATFILFGIVPLTVVSWGFREKPADYGLGLGNWRRGLALVSLLFPPVLLFTLYPASGTEEIRAFYPLDPEAFRSARAFVTLEALRVLLFYPAWEFLFRGFILFGLRRRIGEWPAICLQTIPSCLWHIGMPAGELFSSLAGGVLFGWLALRTGSIVWPLLLHVLIGIGLDLLIVSTS
jgi:membrane protease YdiL (CAAX protease family)